MVDSFGSGAPLENVAADRVRAVRKLGARSARERAGRFLVEGPQGVREALRFAAGDLVDVFATAQAARRHPEIISLAQSVRVHLHEVSPEVAAAMSADAQGILAVANRPRFAPAADPAAELRRALAAPGRPSVRLVAVLSEVRDPGNAGAVIRAADAAGADLVVVIDLSVELTNPKVVRSTAGSLFHLPVVTGVTLPDAVAALRTAGLRVIAAAADGTAIDEPAARIAVSEPAAWVFGNEARGLSAADIALADLSIALPIYGHAESLNLATAAAVCLYASAFAAPAR